MQNIYGKEVLHDFVRFLDFRRKTRWRRKNKMAPKMAAKRTPWDNISQWEHKNSYTRDIKGYKNMS